jgi:DNA-binding NarL/FixJ family response regulator
MPVGLGSERRMTDTPPMASDPVRVFLCDDVAEIRILMRFTLEEDGGLRVVGEAADGEGAVAGVMETRADVILLDLSMPGMDGLEAIQRIRETAPRAGIVVLSGFSARRLGEAAMDLGADRYLEKGEPGDVIRSTIHEVARGRRGERAAR